MFDALNAKFDQLFTLHFKECAETSVGRGRGKGSRGKRSFGSCHTVSLGSTLP